MRYHKVPAQHYSERVQDDYRSGNGNDGNDCFCHRLRLGELSKVVKLLRTDTLPLQLSCCGVHDGINDADDRWDVRPEEDQIQEAFSVVTEVKSVNAKTAKEQGEQCCYYLVLLWLGLWRGSVLHRMRGSGFIIAKVGMYCLDLKLNVFIL